MAGRLCCQTTTDDMLLLFHHVWSAPRLQGECLHMWWVCTRRCLVNKCVPELVRAHISINSHCFYLKGPPPVLTRICSLKQVYCISILFLENIWGTKRVGLAGVTSSEFHEFQRFIVSRWAVEWVPTRVEERKATYVSPLRSLSNKLTITCT